MRKTKDNQMTIIEGIQEDIWDAAASGEKVQQLSDGYHSFNELYAYRKCYNAMLFNIWGSNTVIVHGKEGRSSIEPDPMFGVHKSKCHSDGEPCFDGTYFVVTAMLPTGQISNHYKLKYWDDFHSVPEEPKAKWAYDGHTSEEALERMEKFLRRDY